MKISSKKEKEDLEPKLGKGRLGTRGDASAETSFTAWVASK